MMRFRFQPDCVHPSVPTRVGGIIRELCREWQGSWIGYLWAHGDHLPIFLHKWNRFVVPKHVTPCRVNLHLFKVVLYSNISTFAFQFQNCSQPTAWNVLQLSKRWLELQSNPLNQKSLSQRHSFMMWFLEPQFSYRIMKTNMNVTIKIL